MKVSAPAPVGHAERAEVLDALAMMVGCTRSLAGLLPDGVRPDVLRVDVERGLLFVGEAKHTESPGRADTLVRLQRYFNWAAAHRRLGGTVVGAVCFGREADRQDWAEALVRLAREAALGTPEIRWTRLGPGFVLVSGLWCPPPSSTAASLQTGSREL